jgi:hypothetical protein
MEPFADSSTLPLSIAQVDPTVYVEPGLASVLAVTAVPDAPAKPASVHEQFLAAVVARAGEVEAAEWALDQARAACSEQVAAALSYGVPADKVAAAAGVCASALAELIGYQPPAAVENRLFQAAE